MRILLLPFSLIYKLVLVFRHFLFNIGILQSESFKIPVISVGNLSLGGTGKTPHIEYLIRLFEKKYTVSVLSRGYGRNTKGFYIAGDQSTASEIGDEPAQYNKKFPKILVAVDERRRRGIHKLLQIAKPPEIVLLDDAFQHRYVKPGLNILLTDYHNLYTNDYLVPAGRLRDISSAAKRADIIVVTKTHSVFSPFIERELIEKIQPLPHQKLFFSYINYNNFTPFNNVAKNYTNNNNGTIILITGIANPYPIKEYLNNKCIHLVHIDFPDHHVFSEKDINKVVNEFESFIGRNKMIVTTEKDAMRLTDSPYFCNLEKIPLFYVPIEIAFHKVAGQNFDDYLIDYVRKNYTDNNLHTGKNS